MKFMSILLSFTNNSGLTDDNVYIGFWDPSISATYGSPSQSISPMNSGTFYSLTELEGGVTINSTNSGRVYVCYNDKIGRTEPAPTPTDPYFFQRYDKFEITVIGGASTSTYVNMTSLDYWSIPMSLYALLDGATVQQSIGLLNGSTAQELYTSLLQLTNPPVSGLPGPGGVDGIPMSALVPGSFQQYGTGPTPPVFPSFCRIIGPSRYANSYPNAGIPVLPYDTMAGYLDWLFVTYGPDTESGTPVANLGNGTIANISGNFAGSTAGEENQYKAQTYQLLASISGAKGSETITLSGNGSVVGTFSMSYAYSDLLNPNGIYGANAPFTLNDNSNTTTPANDLYGWVAADFFSGLNLGIIGSSVVVASVSENPVGSLSSSDWWTIPVGSLFSNLQSSPQYYNQYAAILSQYSQAYNTPYSDRLSPNTALISVTADEADTISVVLESANIEIDVCPVSLYMNYEIPGPDQYFNPNVYAGDNSGNLVSPQNGVPCYLWANVQNNSTVTAQSVSVSFFVCIPQGSVVYPETLGTGTVDQILSGQSKKIMCTTPWTPDTSVQQHQCLTAVTTCTGSPAPSTTPGTTLQQNNYQVGLHNVQVTTVSQATDSTERSFHIIDAANAGYVEFVREPLAKKRNLLQRMGIESNIPEAPNGEILNIFRKSDEKALGERVDFIAGENQEYYTKVTVKKYEPGTAALYNVQQFENGKLIGGVSQIIIYT
jgi:hypothetical protein